MARRSCSSSCTMLGRSAVPPFPPTPPPTTPYLHHSHIACAAGYVNRLTLEGTRTLVAQFHNTLSSKHQQHLLLRSLNGILLPDSAGLCVLFPVSPYSSQDECAMSSGVNHLQARQALAESRGSLMWQCPVAVSGGCVMWLCMWLCHVLMSCRCVCGTAIGDLQGRPSSPTQVSC